MEAIERDMALARILRGKISPLTTQAMGPHVEAKKAIYIQTKATKTFCPAVFSVEIVTPTMATKYSQKHIPAAPIKSDLLRPSLSTFHIPGGVMKTLMMLMAMVIRKGLEIPAFLKNAVP